MNICNARVVNSMQVFSEFAGVFLNLQVFSEFAGVFLNLQVFSEYACVWEVASHVLCNR